ncbi:sodium:solute symporter family protein, partial [Desulfosarcina sp.]|nr:sodium:solute symporter family protein [Desulfosarcina sp.]
MSHTTAGFAIFGLYLATIVAIGLLSARYQKSSEDFWVAGRRFGLPMMVMANMAAIINGGSILGGVALIALYGGVGLVSVPFTAFTAGIAVIFFVFAKKLRQSRGMTLPDYMGDRFDSRFLRGWSAFIITTSSVIYLIGQIRAVGFILERLLGVPLFWGLAMSALIFVFYVALGGLLAVMWTSIAQFLFMWVGLFILAPYVFEQVGGWFEILRKIGEATPGWTSLRGVAWSWPYVFSWNIAWFVAYCTRVELVTKMFAARDHRIARCSLPWTILLIMIFLLYGNVYLGGAARLLVWDQIASPDQAFPTLVATLLPPLLAALALTGIASAAMSTSDSLLLISGAAVAHDILRKCIHEPRGIIKSERYYLLVSRLSIVAVGCLAFLGSLPDLALILE